MLQYRSEISFKILLASSSLRTEKSKQMDVIWTIIFCREDWRLPSLIKNRRSLWSKFSRIWSSVS